MKNGIIIIGGHVQALGIMRIFGEENIPVIICDNQKFNICKHSKYCSEFFIYKKESLLEFLLSENMIKNYKNWLIFPTDDSEVELISKNKIKLQKKYKLSTCDWHIISNFYNKINTYKICDKIGIDIPYTVYPDDLNSLKSMEFTYPVIIKPAVMHTFYKKIKKKVFLCRSKNELIKNYLKASKAIPLNEIMIQEIIKGSSENQFSACFYFSNKNSLVSLLAKRKRQHPLDFGNATTFAETVNHPIEIYDNAKKLLSYVNYDGFAEVEFKKDSSRNKFYLLEVNPRTWKWHSISKYSDSPFLLSMYNNKYFEKPIISNSWKKAYFKHLLTDIPISILMFLKGIYIKGKKNYSKTVYAVWDIRDFKPFIFELLYLPYFYFKR
tara:strand:+ start:251 stop:1393 length:1143 start_codon:yes stop_codon:yes gene_type:complete